NLQIGLLVVGAFVIAGVLAYNRWVTRQNAPRTARERTPLGEPVEPVLAPAGDSLAERREPHLDAGAPAEGEGGEGARTLPPTDHGGGATTIEPTLGPLPERRPGPALDALIDVIAPLNLETEVSGEAVLAALPATRRVGSKPFAVECLCAESGEWEPARPHQRYRALQAGVQLATRAGPLNA